MCTSQKLSISQKKINYIPIPLRNSQVIFYAFSVNLFFTSAYNINLLNLKFPYSPFTSFMKLMLEHDGRAGRWGLSLHL